MTLARRFPPRPQPDFPPTGLDLPSRERCCRRKNYDNTPGNHSIPLITRPLRRGIMATKFREIRKFEQYDSGHLLSKGTVQ